MLPESEREHVTIYAHVFYRDIWGEIVERIERSMKRPFTLVVTSVGDIADTIEPPVSDWLVDVHHVKVENRGRDILPFLVAFRQHPTSGVALKLHTKRSPRHFDGEGWRRMLLDSLLPDASTVAKVVDAFVRQDDLGLIAAHGHLAHVWRRSVEFPQVLNRTAMSFGGALTPAERRNARFPAASMFWFRGDALADLRERRIDAPFEDEADQDDGTTAHALERLFGIIAVRRGFRLLAMDDVVAGRRILRRRGESAYIRKLGEDVPSALYGPVRFVWRRLPASVQRLVIGTIKRG